MIQKGRPLSDDEEINEYYASTFVVWNAYARTTQSGVLAKRLYVWYTRYSPSEECLSEFTEEGKEVVAIDDNTSFEEVEGAVLKNNWNLSQSFLMPHFFGKAMRFAVISWQLYQTAKRNIKEGDKVLLVTNPAPVVALVSKLREKKNFELNILVHDVFPENTAPAGLKLPKIAYNILKNIFDKAYSRADQLIAIGRDMKQVLEQKVGRFEHKPKTIVIENWADLDIVSPMELSIHPDKFVLEYAGNIGRVQGLQSMVEYIKAAGNNELEFHLWGTGAEENNLKEYAQKNGMKNVVFHGAYLRSKQSEVINSCDFFFPE